MKIDINGENSVALTILFDETSFLKANNKQQLIGACTKACFLLKTTSIESAFDCIIDIEELAVFYKELCQFLVSESNCTTFSSHDHLFSLKFERIDGFVKCSYECREYSPIEYSISIEFHSDEIQVYNCRKELSSLFTPLTQNAIIFDAKKFSKWW